MPIPSKTTLVGFEDELEKIKSAGEMQGHTRSGRRPIGVDRLLERESESSDTPSTVFGKHVDSETFQKDIEKVSRAGVGTAMALLGTGAVLQHLARKANQDRKMGRMMRLQQDVSGY